MTMRAVPARVRRSVSLPPELVEDVFKVASEELRGNLNRLVIVALQEYVAQQKSRQFEIAMKEMADDESIRAECEAISDGLAGLESDGLEEIGV